MHWFYRCLLGAGAIVSLGCAISATSFRQDVTAQEAEYLAVGNSRIESPAAHITDVDVTEGAPAVILDISGSRVNANSGDIIFNPKTGATSKAHRRMTSLGTWATPTAVFGWVRPGDKVKAAAVAKAKKSQIDGVMGK